MAACSGGPLGPTLEVETAAARWDEKGPDDYSYVYDVSCFCIMTGPVRLTVLGDSVVEAVGLEGSSQPGPHGTPGAFPTIDHLLRDLLDAAEQDPAHFDVEFDAELGYPTRAAVDISEMIADEEFSFEVREFEPAEAAEP